MDETRKQERQTYLIRKTTLAEQDNAPELDDTSPAERLGMMWQLALDAWAFMGDEDAQSRLPRHLVRVFRRQG